MPLLDKYVDVQANEAAFQKALAENDNEGMWTAVFFACQNIAKRIYANRGYIAQEDILYDVVMNSVMMVMRNIQERGHKPKQLSSYCWTRVLCHVNGFGDDKFVKKLKLKLSNIENGYLQEYIEEANAEEEINEQTNN